MEHSGLLSIPEEVFYDNLFPFLEKTDLLRLRRVCKEIKVFSDDYMRNNFSDREMEISSEPGDHTLENFIRLNLPVSRIYLNNGNGEEFFKKPEVPQFLQLFSSSITHLKVKLFYACKTAAENGFYTALTNLEHLEIETIDITYGDIMAFIHNTGRLPLNKFPPQFRNLKTLKLNQILHHSNTHFLMLFVKDLIDFCPNLEFLRYPQQTGFAKGVSFKYLKEYLEERKQNFPDLPNLKYYDLVNHRQDVGPRAVLHFMPFTKTCYDLNVKLLNVDAELLELCWGDPEVQLNFEWCHYSWPVFSLKNVRRSLFVIEIPYMEKLVIASTAKCTFGRVWLGDIPYWPGLKSLDVTIDSEELDMVHLDDGIDVTESFVLVAFLFASVPREELRELRIGFDRNRDTKGNLPCPRAQDVIENCGNVTKLTLTNWLGTNKAVSKLWSGLDHLEEVTLEDCKTLGNVAFVGEDKEDPTFLKLKKLKKVTLSGLEIMPKITDLVFELVFRHLSIKRFYLTSREPIKNITAKGIRSLLSGEFNKSVEKFPFQGWSLHNVPENEFLQLKTDFRSSHML